MNNVILDNFVISYFQNLPFCSLTWVHTFIFGLNLSIFVIQLSQIQSPERWLLNKREDDMQNYDSYIKRHFNRI
jgi:hypothetical protein